MGPVGLLTLALGLCSLGGRAAAAGPHILATPEVTSGSNVLISCNITDPPTPIKSHYWLKGDTKLDSNETALEYTAYMIPKVDHESSGEYHCVFETVPLSRATVYVKGELGSKTCRVAIFFKSQGKCD
ncbi:hypothetical protein JRQ81_009024 [Phrynocephalus forsythii]|uniref:Ig-like domain-containing protein n=1 Tax=Phrynocephalus forsythii TaxID=171643 RepID=A0A9Q0XB99_9SAUR|nr:hypothetical protein JRQ81_009024 [Phrynocephalus forsythii]